MDLHSRPGHQLLYPLAGEPSVIREFGYGVKDVIFGHVSVPPLDEATDHLDHSIDVIAGFGLGVGPEEPQPVEVAMESLRVSVGDEPVRNTFFLRPLDNLVVHVGNVTHIGDVVADVAQIPVNHVEDDQGPSVADVAEVIDGDPADIHPDAPRLQGLE